MTDLPGVVVDSALKVEFCGSWDTVDASVPFLIGREADCSIDDNPYLHRHFLELRFDQLWWLGNVGSRLAATVSDTDGRIHAWLAPGARLPLVFPITLVRFTAGPTTYELGLYLDGAPLGLVERVDHADGTTTLGRVPMTSSQHLLVLALAEPALRRNRPGQAPLPSSAVAAERLGWSITTFNRKLDNVCDKLTRAGVQGLRGDSTKLASGRRARLVEYALAVRMVSVDDLPLLDEADPVT